MAPLVVDFCLDGTGLGSFERPCYRLNAQRRGGLKKRIIHDDEELDDSKPLSFSWVYYIARAKLNLTEKETGRLTYAQFKERYKAYKDTFDLELILTLNRKTYSDLQAIQDEGDEWLK